MGTAGVSFLEIISLLDMIFPLKSSCIVLVLPAVKSNGPMVFSPSASFTVFRRARPALSPTSDFSTSPPQPPRFQMCGALVFCCCASLRRARLSWQSKVKTTRAAPSSGELLELLLSYNSMVRDSESYELRHVGSILHQTQNKSFLICFGLL